MTNADPMAVTELNCGFCHTCLGTRLIVGSDGEEWCPECRQHRRYRTHGYVDGDADTCLDRAGWMLLGSVLVGAEAVTEGAP